MQKETLLKNLDNESDDFYDLLIYYFKSKLKYDPRPTKYKARLMMYGGDVIPYLRISMLRSSLLKSKRTIQFVDLCFGYNEFDFVFGIYVVVYGTDGSY